MRETIWLNDRSNVDLGFLVLQSSKRPGLPATTDRTLAIPGRHGLRDFGADLSARLFAFDCAILASDRFQLQTRVMELSAYLVDSYGRPRELELLLAERPGQTFTVRYSGSFDIDRIQRYGKFSLPLTAYDPFARGPEQIEELTITQSPQVISLASGGNVRTEPVIVLRNIGGNTLPGFSLTNEYILED
ncbi:Phage tail protein [compost metagenome]